jgi:hypothetical protein
VTPETRAAADRANAYLEARRVTNAILRQEDNGVIDSRRNVELRLDDLLTLLAAARQAAQPTIATGPTAGGTTSNVAPGIHVTAVKPADLAIAYKTTPKARAHLKRRKPQNPSTEGM